MPVQVFIWYSDDDKSLGQELIKHLSVWPEGLTLKTVDDLDWSLDDNPVDVWVERAGVIVVLLSVDFCREYLGSAALSRALERRQEQKAIIVPVRVRSVSTPQQFARMQCLPRTGLPVAETRQRDAVWTEIAKAIQEAARQYEQRAPQQPARPPQGTDPEPPIAPPQRRNTPSSSSGGVVSPTKSTPTDQAPTRASLRTLLSRVLKSDSDFEAFVLDFFPRVQEKLSNGMDRVQKANVLLREVNPVVVLEKLRREHPEEVAEHPGILEWEPAP